VVAEPVAAAAVTPAPPVGVRRRRVALTPSHLLAPSVSVPRRRGRPAKVAAEQPIAPSATPTVQDNTDNTDDPQIPITTTVRDLPDQVTPDDYDVVEG
jgi:hypothetical protein